MTSDIKDRPVNAVWLPNDVDNRFGRLFVLFRPTPDSATVVAASRVLFADSFRSAQDALSTGHNSTSAFHDGEILVLMSMDPSSAVSREAAEKQQQKVTAVKMAGIEKLSSAEQTRLLQLKQAIDAAVNNPQLDENGKAEAIKEFLEARQLIAIGVDRLGENYLRKADKEIRKFSAERGVVTHPALFGRELAWSTVRIDFWYNQLDALEKEAQLMNGGKKLPDNLKNIAQRDMATWQYYERDARVSLRRTSENARELVVTSLESGTKPAGPAAAGERSHFSVSMFSEHPGPDSIGAEDDLFRRPDAEKEYQPLLDWLATNHHDFMRLNDFSESFSLLRWLRSTGTALTVIDIAGDTTLATPDRVDIGKGPHIEHK